MNESLTNPQAPGVGIKLPPLRRANTLPFVHVSLDWVRQAQETQGSFSVVTALLVWFRHSVTGEDWFSVSNASAAKFGLNRKQKASGLQALELGGLIRVQRKKGRSPLVTILTKT